MKIIFHIGMGKTGTSAIQSALAENRALLGEWDMESIGLWLGIINPSYIGYAGFDSFAAQDVEALERDAETLYKRLAVRSPDTFIHSNESIFANIHAYRPFISKLLDIGMEIQIVIYVRPLEDWLPSAFVQWNAYHKTHRGRISSFPKKGRELAALYANIVPWIDAFGEKVVVRRFDRGQDIVSNFAEVLGIPLISPENRVWERIEDAETVMRAIFNDRVEEPALPNLFENALRLDRGGAIRSIDEFSKRTLDFGALPDIVSEMSDVVRDINQKSGVDISLSGDPNNSQILDVNVIRDRIVDYLLELSFSQSLRLQRLERLFEDYQVSVDKQS